MAFDDSVYMASLVEGVMPSAKLVHQLLAVCKTPQTLWHQWGDGLLRQVVPAPTAKKWLAKPTDWQTDNHLDRVALQLTQTHTRMVLWQDMPAGLKMMGDPPAWLFARGDHTLLDHARMVAIVGTRQATDYSRLMIPSLVNGLQPCQPLIVSGMAAGVDGMAHQAAISANIPTVAVLGTGLNVTYPAHHTSLARHIAADGGLIVSEYPMNYRGDRYTFPARNRIIAGLSQGVLVTECPVRSGAMITARVALECGREVMALPGNVLEPNSAGPNQLIAQGATPITDAQAIIHALGWQPDALNPTVALDTSSAPLALTSRPLLSQLSDELNTVLKLIPTVPTPIDVLAVHPQLPADCRLPVCLTTLELDGLIRQLPGQLVVRT